MLVEIKLLAEISVLVEIIVLVDPGPEVLNMKILEIVRIKILSKPATTQKTCMKNTQMITKMNKVIIMVRLSDNPRRRL